WIRCWPPRCGPTGSRGSSWSRGSSCWPSRSSATWSRCSLRSTPGS
ncbi:MAG: hypothetical protein AVDCRST_MAG76-526, partial [uncultured Acidimicrobiales bacterium]